VDVGFIILGDAAVTAKPGEVRSTIQRCGKTTKPVVAAFDDLKAQHRNFGD
jgi:hypothetical protein